MRACSAILFSALALQAAEPVDWIVTARFVVTMDAQRRVIDNGAVAVKGPDIVAVGAQRDIDARYSAKQRLDRGPAILLPGLINAHTHAPMSLLRGIADDMTLQVWLEKYIFPAEAKNVTRDFVRLGTQLACAEMMLSGTTLFTDMYYFEDTIAEAAKECGMRAVPGQTIIGFPAPDYRTPQDALAGAEKFIQRFKDDPLIIPAVAPHAIYTNSAETLQAAKALADRYGVPLLIHVSETEQENKDALKAHGKTPTQYLDSLDALARRTVFAHAAWATPDDWKIIVARNVAVAHCPSSNTKLASGIAPIEGMREAGITIGLGPDGPAGSNNDFNLFEEMDLAAKIAKASTRNPQALPAQVALAMATISGAKALGLDSRIGSLESGKRADLITVRIDQPHAIPWHDVYSMLVYALKGSDVRDVMIHGRITVFDRQILTLDLPDVLRRSALARAAVQRSLSNN